MTADLALYFGVRDPDAGHLLYGPGLSFCRGAGDCPPWWTQGLMNGGLLRMRELEDVVDGRVFWTCGGRDRFWFAFFWWDRSGDSRGKSNSGFYVRTVGFEPKRGEALITERDAAFAYACASFPTIVARQRFPLVLQP